MSPDASEIKDRGGCGSGKIVACLIMCCIGLNLLLPSGSAAPPAQTVGVVEFFAPTPLGAFEGLFPEQFAAEDLTAQLTRAAGEGVVIVPRDRIQRAETALRWRDGDVLHFDRLRALARDAGVDWLIVGWITELNVEIGGMGMMPPDDGNGAPTAEATVDIQVFNAMQGRIIARDHQWATTVGVVRSRLAARALHLTLEPSVPAIMRALTAQSP